jgi:hypothetical protein
MKKMYKLLMMLFVAGTLNAQTLQINEFMASNVATIKDENDEFDDWIELHNYGAESVLLDKMYITDSKSNLVKYRFPVGSGSVAAGGFLLIWADNQSAQGNLHTNFALAKGGEFIGILDTSGTVVLDSLSFGAQQDDVSYGRTNNGGDWQTFATPTPGASNGIASAKFTLSNDKSIYFYPNPANDLLTVKSNKQINKITVKDLLGNEMLVSKNNVFSIEHLTNGMYIIEIEQINKDIKVMKFTKN